MTKAHGATVGAQKFLAHLLKAGADRSSAVKFTASINQDGYLTEFDATLPGIDNGKDGEYRVNLSGFASPVTLTKPSGSKVIDAPAASYEK